MIISYKNSGRERLDKFLAGRFSNYSRNYFQKLIENNQVIVNNKAVKANHILKMGDRIKIKFQKDLESINLQSANIKLDILFENDDLIVINKSAGLVVHPGAGNQNNTLVNALLNYYPNIRSATHDQSNVSLTRPGIVHRLDKDTTGVLIVAKNKKALDCFSKQIADRKTKKIYLAICFGWPKNDRGTITNYLGRNPKNRKLITDVGIERGREAISTYKVIKYFEKNGIKLSLIEFNIKTGRTHQIRYQAKFIGIPVFGDQIYGTKESILITKKLKIKRQLLHAKDIYITLPNYNKPSRFSAPMPSDFQNILE